MHPIPSEAKLAIGVKPHPIRLAQSPMIANLASPLASSAGSNATGNPLVFPSSALSVRYLRGRSRLLAVSPADTWPGRNENGPA